MRRLVNTVLALAATVAISPAAARAQSADAIVDRAVAAWAKVKTARGSFEQTVSNALTSSSATARGTFVQERPNRIAIRFSDPASDAIVSDGKAVWVYLPSSSPGRVIKRSATDGAVPIDLTGQFLESPHTRYDITSIGTAVAQGHAAHVLRLVAKPGVNAPVSKATIWVDDDDSLIREFESTEASGVTRHIKLTELTLNTGVARDAFTFAIPSGVKVLDQTKP
jgi:outer membrane lipoprotein carrier protein